MKAVTILDRLDAHAREWPDRPALSDPRGGRYDAWDTISWKDYRDQVEQLARAFHALGHRPGQGVAILGPNCSAWVLADLAAMSAGGLPAGIYATSTAEQAQYIIRHCKASIAVVCDADVARHKLFSGPLPDLKAVILFPGQEKPADAPAELLSWSEALAKSAAVPASAIHAIRNQAKPQDTATLIYTSGTTGQPKAVRLTHHNILWTAAAAEPLARAQRGDRTISYLPLSHVAEQMLSICVPIEVAAHVHFVANLNDLPDALKQVRPTSFFGVPRVWEKIKNRVETGVAAAPAHKQRMFHAARRVGQATYSAEFEGRVPPRWAALLRPVFERLVFRPFREKLGLDQARICATGAAVLSAEVRDFFLSLGVPLGEVYGQSETSGPTTFNDPGNGRLGTVGRPLPGIELKIAPDGEIWVRAPNVFPGYLYDEEATRATLSPDGWLYSGDVGEVDGRGFLKITDRKKDLIITAGGKNVAPQNIERLLCDLPLISQAVVVGESQKYLVALVTLVPDQLERFAKAQGLSGTGTDWIHDPALERFLQQEIEREVNPKLARYETIKRFAILPEELSEERGELTPTLKIKRRVVGERYRAMIERLYRDPPPETGHEQRATS